MKPELLMAGAGSLGLLSGAGATWLWFTAKDLWRRGGLGGSLATSGSLPNSSTPVTE
jgi:hypothetical protein